MALVIADRVKETTTTTGTGTINLAGAASGFQSFVSGVGNSNTTFYTIEDANGAWEIGIGTITDASPDTLARTTVLATSNGDTTKITLSSGTHTVFGTYPAGKAVYLDASGNLSHTVDISSDTNLAGGTGITLTGDTLSTTDSEIVHDNLSGFVANEHIDWTTDQGSTNIHAGNYTDTNTMGSGFTVSATTDTTATTITEGEDLFFAAGTGITCETTADGTVTISCTVTDTNTTYTKASFDLDHLFTLVGATADTSENLGTFTGSTIADSQTIKAAIQAVETAVETKGAIAGSSSIVTVGTISSGTWQGTAIAQAYIANDAINGDKIADDAVNSEHYAAGSIDEEHLNATNSPTDNYILSYDDASGGFTWVAAGAGEANQNAFSTVAVTGQDNVAADSATDTLNLAAGSNVTITTTAASDTVTIAATDTNTMGSGFTVSATTDSNATTITQGDDLMFAAGTGITCETTADGTVTISCTVTDTNTTYTKASFDVDHLFTLVGASADTDEHLGTFTGSTISDNQTIKAAIQALETAVETKGAGDITGVDLTGGTGISIDSETNTGSGAYSSTITCNLEGTELASTGETGTAKFLRVDGDGTCSWQVPPDTDTTYTKASFDLDHLFALAGASADTDENLGTFTGSTISDSRTIKQALQDLETELETKGAGDMTGVDLTGGTGISIDSETNTGSGAYSSTITCNLEGTELASTGETGTAKFLRVDGDGTCSWQVPPDTNTTYAKADFDIDHLFTLVGASADTDENLGTFTGSTISDSRTIKQALQDLETELETKTTNTGDITGVDLTGGTGISIDSETNTGSGAYSSTITCNLEGTELASTGETGTSKFLRVDGDGTCSWQVPPDTNTTYSGGTNLTLAGTTFNVDDAFLKNNADDTTSGTVTMANLIVGDAGNIGSASDTDAIAIASDGEVTLSQRTTFSKAVKTPLKSNTDGATITFDLDEASTHTVTLGDNRTLAISNEDAGQKFIINLVQDGTGSRTVTWFSTIKWAGGSAPTLTTTADKADSFGFLCTGTDAYYGFVIGQNI